MNMTSFRIRKVENPTNRLVAKCTVTFDNMFAVSDIKILVKEDGELYMGMPSRKTAAGTFKDEAYPVNAQARAALENILFGAVQYCMDNEIANLSGTAVSEKESMLEQNFTDFETEVL